MTQTDRLKLNEITNVCSSVLSSSQLLSFVFCAFYEFNVICCVRRTFNKATWTVASDQPARSIFQETDSISRFLGLSEAGQKQIIHMQALRLGDPHSRVAD